MTPSDYPRWMFHRTKEAVIVQSEDEESALGAGWSRRVTFDDPGTAEPDEDEEPQETAPDSDEEPAELPASDDAAPIRKRAPRAAGGRRKRG